MCVGIVDGGRHSVVVDVGGHDDTVVFDGDVVGGAVMLFFFVWLLIAPQLAHVSHCGSFCLNPSFNPTTTATAKAGGKFNILNWPRLVSM